MKTDADLTRIWDEWTDRCYTAAIRLSADERHRLLVLIKQRERRTGTTASEDENFRLKAEVADLQQEAGRLAAERDAWKEKSERLDGQSAEAKKQKPAPEGLPHTCAVCGKPATKIFAWGDGSKAGRCDKHYYTGSDARCICDVLQSQMDRPPLAWTYRGLSDAELQRRADEAMDDVCGMLLEVLAGTPQYGEHYWRASKCR